MDGIINIYKEAGYTSFDVVAKLRGILKTKKIGHTGTLDPQATGVLPVCLGRATKLCELMLEKEKTYEAVILLGVTTDTEDLTGKVLSEQKSQVSKEALLAAAEHFTGPYDQVPPMYSALKVDGKRLYELARQGKEVERTPRPVIIFENTVTDVCVSEDGTVAEATLRVRCSKGTYIRSLLRDMGEYLGCGACMKSLRRTQAGAFKIDTAVTLLQVEQARDAGTLDALIQPIDKMLERYGKCTILPEWEKYLYNGNKLTKEQLCGNTEIDDQEGIRIYDTNDCLIGLYRYHAAENIFRADKMFLP